MALISQSQLASCAICTRTTGVNATAQRNEMARILKKESSGVYIDSLPTSFFKPFQLKERSSFYLFIKMISLPSMMIPNEFSCRLPMYVYGKYD